MPAAEGDARWSSKKWRNSQRQPGAAPQDDGHQKARALKTRFMLTWRRAMTFEIEKDPAD